MVQDTYGVFEKAIILILIHFTFREIIGVGILTFKMSVVYILFIYFNKKVNLCSENHSKGLERYVIDGRFPQNKMFKN